MDRSGDWLRAAHNDLQWGESSLKEGFYAQVCFIGQQIAEKSLKALALSRGFDRVKSHSVVRIAKELGINGEIEAMGKLLDQYYIPARYPDAFPEGAPQDFFSANQAQMALEYAAHILNAVENMIQGTGAK